MIIIVPLNSLRFAITIAIVVVVAVTETNEQKLFEESLLTIYET